jgi:hypothetical protein
MRTSLAVTIVSTAILTSPLAYGQVKGPGGTPLGPAVGGRATPSRPPIVAPAGDALKDLAGGGFADPNYVPPGEKSKQPTRHRVTRAPRTGWASYRFVGYNSYKAFPYRYRCCYCDY